MQYSKIALAVMLTAAATAVSATDIQSTAAVAPASCSKMPTAANAPLR